MVSASFCLLPVLSATTMVALIQVLLLGLSCFLPNRYNGVSMLFASAATFDAVMYNKNDDDQQQQCHVDISSLPSAATTTPRFYWNTERTRVVDRLLNTLWKPFDGYSSNDAAAPTRSTTYGELTALGARQVFYHMGLLSSPPPPPSTNTIEKEADDQLSHDTQPHNGNDRVVFVDLGSGTGKVVAQAYLEVERLDRAVGIEFVRARHDVAQGALDALLRTNSAFSQDTDLSNQNRTLEVWHGNFFQTNLSHVFRDATHIFMSSLCFPQETLEPLVQHLAQHAVHLQMVATSKRLPEYRGLFGKPAFSATVEMSWTKNGSGSQVYFYRVNHSIVDLFSGGFPQRG